MYIFWFQPQPVEQAVVVGHGVVAVLHQLLQLAVLKPPQLLCRERSGVLHLFQAGSHTATIYHIPQGEEEVAVDDIIGSHRLR